MLCFLALGQDQTSLGEAARQAKSAKSAAPNKAAKVITNETLNGQAGCPAPAQSVKDAAPQDEVRTAFLSRISGRWNLSYFRKGSQSWLPDHGSSQPKNQTHYLFGPTELAVESRPEFNPPSITARLSYGSVRRISSDLFDLAMHKPCEPATEEIKRFKLSADGKTLEIAMDAEGNPEPTVQVLVLVDAHGVEGMKPR
jgi:hypothetical protein